MVVQNRKIKPGKNGVNYVMQVVDVNNCNFNSIIQENEVGIDGYIEIFDECDVPTGEIVFVQIKTGKSYYNVEKGICSIPVGLHREYWMSIQNKVFGIVSGELSGKLYQKSHPYSSHFHVLQESDKYIDSLELNHFITKYEERANRDGKPTNIYCINYGLAKKNNIIWGKPKGNENRTYFIERPFNYTSLILEQIKEVKVIRCTNASCNRIFTEDELIGLKFTGFKCPDCQGDVIIESKVDAEIVQDLKNAERLPLLERAELDILIELNAQNGYIPAKDIAEEVDMNSRRIARICKKLAEQKGLVVRDTQVSPYKYAITEQGKKYCVYEER